MSETQHSPTGQAWVCTAPGTAVSSFESISLASLVKDLNPSVITGDPANCFINLVSDDSREMRSGALFVALKGSNSDGHDFIEDAVRAGCTALLLEKGYARLPVYENSDLCILEVNDSREAYGALAEILFLHPAQTMTLLGITGTNGKTTVSYLLEEVLQRNGRQVGVLGTISYRYYDLQGSLHHNPAPFTTPEPMLLQQSLREMADNGVDTVIMEVSSHGLHQNRLGNLCFDVAAFTNLSRDHLDYHLDMEKYFSAKLLLFTKHLCERGTAVITYAGKDATWSDRLRTSCLDNRKSVLSCGSPDCSFYPVEVRGSLRKTEITLHTPEGEDTIVSPLVGDFNVENIQTAYAMARASGVARGDICEALSHATGAPGRMQKIAVSLREQGLCPAVFVDYAHTPDALKQVLKTVKMLPHTNLYCVFGCGGDRDSGKRQLMGEVAGNYADVAILCDDNPRSEDPAVILEAITEGILRTSLVKREGVWLEIRDTDEQGFVVEPDRHVAISAAIAVAGKDDIVLIAGKGHENYQLTATGRRFFDDSLEATTALCGWKIESLLRATSGNLIGKGNVHLPCAAIKTDSRTVEKGDVFVALIGERFDAHDYLDQVTDAGAACLIVERAPEKALPLPVILVDNTEEALGDLAAYRRSCIREISSPKLIAITGSSGKTTVKEMCAGIFSEQWRDQVDAPSKRVLKTEGNFNNLIGLPLSLLPVMPKHRAVVLEMGMNRPGEIKRLAEIADPDIACILNVHGAHLLGLGTIEGVAKAKEELFEACGKSTVLVINKDDSRVMNLSQKYTQKKLYFGLQGDHSQLPDVYATDLETGDLEEQHFILHVGTEQARVTLQVPGNHNVLNALAAATIAYAADIDILRIAKGLSAFVSTDRRMEILNGPGGTRIVNDTYNANPESMKAGINTLRSLGLAKRMAILGDMLELGADSALLHEEIGAYAADADVDFLGLIGEFATATEKGALAKGMDKEAVQVFTEQDDSQAWVREMLRNGNIEQGSYILIKGSRGMHLDKLVEQLIGT